MKKIISILLTLILCVGVVSVSADESIGLADETLENVTVTAQGKILQKDVDYTLTYRDNVNPGTATVTVNFIGNYEGTMEKTFEIVRKKRTSSGGGSGGGWTVNIDNKNDGNDNSVLLPNVEYDPPYVTGYEDNTFRPDNHITRAESTTLIARVNSFDVQENNKLVFSDISAHWAKGYISAAADKGIVNGYGDDTFRPDNHITRAEFAKIIAKLTEKDIPKKSAGFSDAKGHWAEPYIAALAEKDIINGYSDGTYRPDAPITRAETVAIINRVVPRNGNSTTVKQFADVDSSYWAYEEIMKAVNDSNV